MSTTAPTIERWGEMLSVDRETGALTWKVGQRCGERAGYVRPDGYRYIQTGGVAYLEHRIVWALLYGAWPNGIDHINMARDDNRPCNLREASVSENNRNRRMQRNNTAGFKGVTRCKKTGKYVAQINFNHRCYRLGNFDTAERAGQAYADAAKELHGDFARAIEAKVRGIGSVPPSDLALDSNADSVHQAGRSGGGAATEPGGSS